MPVPPRRCHTAIGTRGEKKVRSNNRNFTDNISSNQDVRFERCMASLSHLYKPSASTEWALSQLKRNKARRGPSSSVGAHAMPPSLCQNWQFVDPKEYRDPMTWSRIGSSCNRQRSSSSIGFSNRGGRASSMGDNEDKNKIRRGFCVEGTEAAWDMGKVCPTNEYSPPLSRGGVRIPTRSGAREKSVNGWVGNVGKCDIVSGTEGSDSENESVQDEDVFEGEDEDSFDINDNFKTIQRPKTSHGTRAASSRAHYPRPFSRSNTHGHEEMGFWRPSSCDLTIGSERISQLLEEEHESKLKNREFTDDEHGRGAYVEGGSTDISSKDVIMFAYLKELGKNKGMQACELLLPHCKQLLNAHFDAMDERANRKEKNRAQKKKKSANGDTQNNNSQDTANKFHHSNLIVEDEDCVDYEVIDEEFGEFESDKLPGPSEENRTPLMTPMASLSQNSFVNQRKHGHNRRKSSGRNSIRNIGKSRSDTVEQTLKQTQQLLDAEISKARIEFKDWLNKKCGLIKDQKVLQTAMKFGEFGHVNTMTASALPKNLNRLLKTQLSGKPKGGRDDSQSQLQSQPQPGTKRPPVRAKIATYPTYEGYVSIYNRKKKVEQPVVEVMEKEQGSSINLSARLDFAIPKTFCGKLFKTYLVEKGLQCPKFLAKAQPIKDGDVRFVERKVDNVVQ
eukprot:Nk52_evm14s1569 gene=Nk52_evmTU14s1569